MIQKYWGQPGCLCLHYIKRTNDGAPLPDSSAIFQRMKKGLCTNAYFSLTRQPRGNMQKGTLSCDNAPFARLFSCNLFARCP